MDLQEDARRIVEFKNLTYNIYIYVEFYCCSCFFLMHKSHMKPHGKLIFPQASTRLGLF